MGRELNRLTARGVQAIKTPGRHADGRGLYFVVGEDGSRRWVVLYRFNGKRREMGLGPLATVPLATARELTVKAQASITAGIDPIKARAHPTAVAVAPHLFSTVAEAYMADRETTWRNPVHRRQWRQTLEVQAAGLWNMPVAAIGTEDVLGALRPIWQTKSETARRMRGRIELVLGAATARGLREGANPARWRGHLDAILPQTKKLQRGHHPAMPYAELPAFYAQLVEREAATAIALRFAILTAARAGEVRGMVWREVDLAKALWTIPGARMKAKREHRVPLSQEAASLLPAAGEGGVLVFPSMSGRMQSDMAFNMLLRRMGQDKITTHGFRSTFRDWVDAETNFPRELAETALAHLVGDETERAYRRGDVLEKRRHLMDAWMAFVVSKTRISSS